MASPSIAERQGASATKSRRAARRHHEQQEDALLGFLHERARVDGDLTAEEVDAMQLTRITERQGASATKSRRSVSRSKQSVNLIHRQDKQERVEPELELSDVQRELSDVTEWYPLGVQLKVPTSYLKSLDIVHRGNTERCKLDTLEHWMNNSDEVSWERLADALSHVSGHAHIVKSLMKKVAVGLSSAVKGGQDLVDFSQLPVPVLPPNSQPADQQSQQSKLSADVQPSPITTVQEAEGDECLRDPTGPNTDNIYSLAMTESEEGSESVENWKLPEALSADQLEVETHRIQTSFNILFTKACQALEEKGISVEQLVFFLEGQPALEPVTTADHRPVLRDELPTLRKVKSIMEVFSILRSYCSFFNYILLAGLIDMYCHNNDAVRQAENKFRQHLKQYYRQRVCNCPKRFGIVKSKDKVKMKIDKQWASVRVGQLAFLRDSIAHTLHLKRYTLFLCAAERGCFEVTFSVPEFVVDAVFLELSVQQKEELCELGITNMTCRGHEVALPSRLSTARTMGLIHFSPDLRDGVSEEEQETRAVFSGYVFQYDTTDGVLSRDQARTSQSGQLQTSRRVRNETKTLELRTHDSYPPDQEESVPLELIVNQPRSKSSFTLTMPPSEQLGVSEHEQRLTAVALLSYIGETSQSDPRLSETEAKLLYFKPVTERKDDVHAAEVGVVYGSVKNDFVIDSLRQEVADSPDVKRFIELYIENAQSEEASNVTLESFVIIARGVLDCDEKGIATSLSPGRIIALFFFSYEICIAFLRYHSVFKFLDFLARLVTLFIQFLAKSHFYEWLQELGGWEKLLTVSKRTSNLFGLITGGVVGVMVVAAVYWAVRRLII